MKQAALIRLILKGECVFFAEHFERQQTKESICKVLFQLISFRKEPTNGNCRVLTLRFDFTNGSEHACKQHGKC